MNQHENFRIRFCFTIAVLALPLWLGSCHNQRSETRQGNVKEVNAQEPDTLLFPAALNGDLETLTRLLNRGVNVNLADRDRRTALMYASYNGHTELVRLMLVKGADINCRDINGRTALMFAASGPFPETVKLLLDNQAQPNIADYAEKFTALMYAAAEGQAEVVKILLDNHADPALKDVKGEQALTFARKNGHQDVVKMLMPVSGN
jgi:ankyrin repeat protein